MLEQTLIPFTRKEALATGVTDDTLVGPHFQRLFHGLYLSARVRVTVLDRARAALRISAPGSYVSHHTAAAIWGGWIPEVPETHISVPSGRPRSKRQGIRAHRAPASTRFVDHRGLLLSPPLQTFHELAAARLDFVELVILGDSLVKARRITLEQFQERFLAGPGRAPRWPVGRRDSYAAGWTRPPSRACGCWSCSRDCRSPRST